METKEKAISLFLQFYSKVSGINLMYLMANGILINSEDSHVKTAKQCTLLAVDEILKQNPVKDTYYEEYWQQVKQEIESL